jgi:hypothetical protein
MYGGRLLKHLQHYIKKRNIHFGWEDDPATYDPIAYHKGIYPLKKPSDEVTEERDAAWVPRYSKIIEEFKVGPEKQFLMYVGLAHGYNFFKNLRKLGLVKRMERYNATHGWKPFDFTP